MKPFDHVLMVDWSAANAPTRARKDAIWIAEDTAPAAHFATRSLALSHITQRLEAHRAAGERVLVGFDFGFGYPAGLLPAAPAGTAFWDWMGRLVQDGPDNRNNRFDVAERLNGELSTPVFWGRVPSWDAARYPTLARQKPAAADVCFRAVERHLREAGGPGRAVKSAVHVAGAAGTVGGQIIMGLPTLAALKAHFGAGLGCWPFEPDAMSAPLVLAEIYPSLLDEAVAREIDLRGAAGGQRADIVKDAVQVELCAQAVLAAQAQDGLEPLLEIPPEHGAIARTEGWILGATDPFSLGRALDGAISGDKAATAAPPQLRNDCFALPPGVHWTPVDDALAHLRGALTCTVGTESVALEAALGRVLSEDVLALRDNPPTANAAVDGYGFSHATAALEMPLRPGRAAAGVPFEGRVPSGEAVRILTGAPVPEGVDTVVMQEDVAVQAGVLRLSALPRPGANTRCAGEDRKAGEKVFEAGHVLGAPDLATLAAIGHGTIRVRKRVRVGVLSTGDELAAPGSPVAPAQVYDANGPMLRGLIAGWGLDVVTLGRAPDDRDALRHLLNKAAERCDALLTSGGASGGDEDHMSALLTREGQQALWRIAVKPGRPLALGLWNGMPVFGLPGNPVAAFVTAVVFARPSLGILAGAQWRVPASYLLPACFEKAKKGGRREFLRGRMTETGVEAYASEGSGRVSGLSWANCLIDLPAEACTITRGEAVRVLPYTELLRL